MPQRAEARPCEWVLERLEAWVDGDLNEAGHASVMTHVESCESCQRERFLAEEVAAELRALPEFELPDAVVRAVDRRTRPGVVESLFTSLNGVCRRPFPVMTALAAVVAMIVILSPWPNNSSGPEYSEQEITRAAHEVRLAFAYVGAITKRAEVRVTERVLDHDVAAKTVRGVRKSLQFIGEVGSGLPEPPATPQPTSKGS
jgi:anti-sigma factor RsiW